MNYQIIEHQHIFPSETYFRQCHASTVCVLEPEEGSAGFVSGKSKEGAGSCSPEGLETMEAGLASGNQQEPSICCAWFAGDHEKAKNVAIWFSRKVNGVFTPPVKVGDVEGIPCWNPVLFSVQGKLWLFYKVGEEIPEWRTYVKESADGGCTWSEARELVPGDIGGRGPVKNKCLRLKSGRILAPASYEREVVEAAYLGTYHTEGTIGGCVTGDPVEGVCAGLLQRGEAGGNLCGSSTSDREDKDSLCFTSNDQWNCFVDISDDEGRTWKRSAFVPMDRSAFSGTGMIQPTLWQEANGERMQVLFLEGNSEGADKQNGRVHMLTRSSEGAIYHSFSEDEGLTWSEAKRTALPNNNSGIDVAQLADGRLVLVYNPVAGNWAARSPIAFSVSEDNGRTWSEPQYLDHVPCDRNVEWAEFSYPAIVARGQEVFLTYTWKRRTIAYWRILFR